MQDCPENYNWWIDSIQDNLCQISKRYELLNPDGGACKHVCDETYEDLNRFIDCIINNNYCDVPANEWNGILKLRESDDLDNDHAVKIASDILDSQYFSCRKRWKYGI